MDVLGRVKMYEYHANIVIDLGSSQYFVSTTFVRANGLQTNLMQQSLCSITNWGGSICTKIAKSCSLELGIVILDANLLVFNLLKFDIILEKGWFFQH